MRKQPLIYLSFALCVYILSGTSTPITAQSDYQLFQKVTPDSLFVRWAPQDYATFARGIRQGYGLRVYALTPQAGSQDFDRELLSEQTIAPLAFAEWQGRHRGAVWDTITFQMVYFDRIDPGVLEENYPIEEDGSDSWEELRWRLSNYAQNFDNTNIIRAGMGYSLALRAGVARYAIQVYPQDATATDTLWFDIRPGQQPPAVPDLTVEFKDSYADLNFRTAEFERTYFGYRIQKSLDEGRNWRSLTEQPFVNPYDTAVTAEALKYIYHTDTISDNDVPITYRLYGLDYLGGRSQRYSEVKGSGYDEIRFSPLLLETVQTDSNYAVIRWDMDPTYEHLVREFRIIHTDTLGGVYTPAVIGIAPDQREIAVPMAYRSNFYRVQAVPFRGPIKSSFESLILMYDAVPPAMPLGLTGTVDTNGIVRLSWQANTEDDLAGYRVFKSFFADTEFAGITPTPLTSLDFTDTLSMASGNEWVYYQLRAMDIRGNGSAFTPTLRLKKPDVFPPPAPRFKAPGNREVITLAWHESPAPDASTTRLFRRVLEQEDTWSLIATFERADNVSSYTDPDVQPDLTYVYTLTAIDDDGLESEPAQPVSVRLRNDGVRTPVEDWQVSLTDESRHLTLSWAYATAPKEFWLYKAAADGQLSLLKVLAGDQRSYTDSAVRTGQRYRYALRAYFADGSASPFTAIIEQEVP